MRRSIGIAPSILISVHSIALACWVIHDAYARSEFPIHFPWIIPFDLTHTPTASIGEISIRTFVISVSPSALWILSSTCYLIAPYVNKTQFVLLTAGLDLVSRVLFGLVTNMTFGFFWSTHSVWSDVLGVLIIFLPFAGGALYSGARIVDCCQDLRMRVRAAE